MNTAEVPVEPITTGNLREAKQTAWQEKFYQVIRKLKSNPARSSRLGLAIVAATFVIATVLTWRKWPDIIVDFGAQLYVPWRLANGAVLYRDLYHFAGGPLSQYFNALLFKIFGASFLTLVVANLIFVAAMLLLIYRRFLAATNAITATIICLGIIFVFVFNQYPLSGNYNYITPYSHEALHGLLLSIFAIALLSDWIGKMQLRFAFAAGLCSGLVFLTKPDIFLALALCDISAFILLIVTRRQISLAIKSLAAFLSAGILPLLLFFLFFLKVESWRDSLQSVIFGWLPIFQSKIIHNQFYQWCLGFDRPLLHLRQMAVQFITLVAVVIFYAFALRRTENLKFKWLQSPAIILMLLLLPLLIWAAWFDWRDCGSSLPLLSLSACVLIGWNYKKRAAFREPVFPLLWSVFGFAMLLKMGLFPRIWHYGFVLAMPALAGAVYLLLWLLPISLEKKYSVSARRFRLIFGSAIMVGFGSLFYQSQLIYAQKTFPVARGVNKMFAFGTPEQKGADFSAALAWIEKKIPRDATIAAVPEGVMINFLAQRVNPTPCLSWDPNMMFMFGSTEMTAAFEKNPPDYIFMVERDTSEFGVGYFGQSPEFGASLMQWVGKNYQQVQLIGEEPLQNGKFGIKILKRISFASKTI